MLGMSAHGPGSCAFIVSAINLFGSQGETAESTKKRCRRLHCDEIGFEAESKCGGTGARGC